MTHELSNSGVYKTIEYNATPLYYNNMNVIAKILKKREMSVYLCSKLSGIPYTTLLELLNDKTDIKKCSVETIYKIAKTLNVSMEYIIENNRIDDFEIFKSTIKHRIKEEGELSFLQSTYKNDDIRYYWNQNDDLKALYLLAMVDYLSRIHNLPLVKNYDDLRNYKMENPVLPFDVALLDSLNNNNDASKKAIDNSIAEFMNYNIVEGDIYNAV